MSKRFYVAILAILVVCCAALAFGQDSAQNMLPEGMPPMGPPKEITECGAKMVGTWDAATEFRMDPKGEFVASNGVAVYNMVVGGAALQCNYTSSMMGMPFEGLGLTTYNRDNQQWTTSWIDNMGGHMSVYSGTKADGKLVLTGTDTMGGETWHTRITETEPKDGKYDFTLEHSTDGGKTWAVFMKALYTKRM